MPWVVSFIVSWILFVLLVDVKRLKECVYGGIMALALASFMDWGGQQLQLYTFRDLIIPWFGCSIFYKLGPVFSMGIIFCQYVSKNKWLQLLNILAFSISFILLEFCVLSTGVAKYIHWHFLASSLVDLLTFSTLTWISLTFNRKNKTIKKLPA